MLDVSDIFDLPVITETTENIDQILSDLSENTGMDLHLLYFSVVSISQDTPETDKSGIAQGSGLTQLEKMGPGFLAASAKFRSATDSGGRQTSPLSTMEINLHIYGLKDGTPISLEELNSYV